MKILLGFHLPFSSIAFEGRIAVIGFAGGDIPKIPANILLVKSCSAVGVYWGSYSIRHPGAFRESVENVLQLLGERKINPHYSAKFKLDQVSTPKQFIKMPTKCCETCCYS